MMFRLFELFRGYFRINMVRFLAYRVETVIWLVGMILPPVVFLSVWQSAAQQAGRSLAGFSRGDIATYFIAVMLVNHVTQAWAVFLWESYVREGYLSYVILRPNPVMFQDFAENVAFKVATLPVMLLTAVGLAATFAPTLHWKPWAVVAFIPALLLAFALRFTVDWITATWAALNMTKVDAVNVLFFFILLMTSGQMAPLPLLPRGIQMVANALPFRWMLDFPVRLLMGRVGTEEALIGFAAQAGWLVAMTGIGFVAWRSGMRKFTAVGL